MNQWIAAIRNASVEELCLIRGISRPDAERIHEYYHKNEPGANQRATKGKNT